MKRILLLLIASFALHPAVAQQTSLLLQAKQAYAIDDIDTAKLLVGKVLAKDPQNLPARKFLKAIESEQAQAATLTKQYQELILPKVEFRDVPLGSVLDALKLQVSEASHGKIKPNFVIRGIPGEKVDGEDKARLFFSLSNIPFSEVLRYVSTLVGMEIVVKPNAIVFKPIICTTPAAPPQ